MPDITLTDESDFEIDIHPETQDALLGLLRHPARIRMLGATLQELWAKPLSKSPLQTLDFALEFEAPTGMAFGKTSLNIEAGIQGQFSVLTRAGKALFPQDRFLQDRQAIGGRDDEIQVPQDHAYLVLGWGGSFGAGVEAAAGDLEFGFSAKARSIQVANYQLFPLETSFGKAVEVAFRRFSLPKSFSDLEGLQPGTVVTVKGEGVLRFSFSAELTGAASLFSTSTIAESAGALGDLASIDVTAGASLQLSQSVRLFSSYEYRFFKHSADRLRLGIYSQKGKESQFELSAAAGLSAGVGGFDLTSQILGLFTGSSIDADQLKQAGLDDNQVEKIEEAVEKAATSKLELGLDLGLQTLRSTGPAFLFEIGLEQLGPQPEAKDSIGEALRGDFSGWTQRGKPLPSGIEVVRSLDSAARSKVRSLRFNLFGLFNHLSLKKLLSQSFVEYDPQGDAVLVLDRLTAERYQIDLNRLADQQQRLSRLVLDSLMITAAYVASGLAPEGLQIDYRHFALLQKTPRARLKDLLDVAQALQLLSIQGKQQILSQADDFGPTSLLAETGYRKKAVLEMFVQQAPGNRSEPLDRSHYDSLGRQAFVQLLEGDRRSGAVERANLLRDDALWVRVTALGNPQVIVRLPEVSQTGEVTAQVFAGDYLSIRWWSLSMQRLSRSLADLLNFLQDHPGVALTDADYAKRRKDLARAASKVAEGKQSRFDDPWGMIAMDLAANRQGTARVLLTIPELNGFEYEKERGRGRG